MSRLQSFVSTLFPRWRGAAALAGGVVHVSESWLFYYGAAGSVLSRALDAELCRSGGAVQVVGVERGERGERRGLGTIPSLPGVRPTACRERRARYALEGRPLGAVTIP